MGARLFVDFSILVAVSPLITSSIEGQCNVDSNKEAQVS